MPETKIKYEEGCDCECHTTDRMFHMRGGGGACCFKCPNCEKRFSFKNPDRPIDQSNADYMKGHVGNCGDGLVIGRKNKDNRRMRPASEEFIRLMGLNKKLYDTDPPTPDRDAICQQCAIARGGKWPGKDREDGRMGTCDYCEGQKSCCSIDDWEWPDELTPISGDKDSICNDCAYARDGVWPDGHCATFWSGTCDYCGRARSCCSIGDWDWPKADYSYRRD